MTPGAALLKLRQKFGHGLRVAYFRDVIRPRILSTAPVHNTNDAVCEIHVLTSAKDWLNLIWALKSFYRASNRRYALCIHEDGTLSDDGKNHLLHHFPNSRLISKSEADQRVFEKLAKYPLCLEFRKTNLLAPKVFDFVEFQTGGRMLLLDSDVLFFRSPTALLERIEDPNYRLNTFNTDSGFAYTVQPEVVRERLGFELHPLINSGLALVHRRSVRLDWIEQFLALPGLLQGHFWRIEQTILALCSSKFGVELLPPQYTLDLNGKIGDLPMRHYVGAIRHLMYREGMSHLVRHGMLQTVNGSAAGK